MHFIEPQKLKFSSMPKTGKFNSQVQGCSEKKTKFKFCEWKIKHAQKHAKIDLT